jgi:NADH:ubiquinone oxidoreductase subunit 3 (subunit A)
VNAIQELAKEKGIDPEVLFKAVEDALVFLLFDIETIFLYPWAVKFSSLGLFALIEMFIFVGILTIGLWYAWKKGALTWK